MTLLYRLSKLFKADMHAVVDNLEEPLPLLKQSIREMEDIVLEQNKHLKRLQNNEQHLNERQQQILASIKKTNEELDICFSSGNDNLARNLVKRKLEYLAMQDSLALQQKKNASKLSEIRKSLEEKQPILESLKQKLDAFSNEEPQEHHSHLSPAAISDTDIDVALLREKQLRQKGDAL